MLNCIVGSRFGCCVLFSNRQKQEYSCTSYEFMKHICEAYLVDFNSSRLMCAKTLEIRHKPPVVISIMDCCVYFPTRGYLNDRCIWINYRNVVSFHKKGKHSTSVLFRDKTRYDVDVDIRTIRNQMNRCETLIERKIQIWKI